MEYLFNFRFTRPDEDHANVYEVGYHVRAETREEAEAKLRRLHDHLAISKVVLYATCGDEWTVVRTGEAL